MCLLSCASCLPELCVLDVNGFRVLVQQKVTTLITTLLRHKRYVQLQLQAGLQLLMRDDEDSTNAGTVLDCQTVPCCSKQGPAHNMFWQGMSTVSCIVHCIAMRLLHRRRRGGERPHRNSHMGPDQECMGLHQECCTWQS